MKTQVEALREHRYGGKLKRKGDRYAIAEAGHLRLFKALRWVQEYEEPEPEPVITARGTYLTRALDAEVKPKRKYTRKAKVE